MSAQLSMLLRRGFSKLTCGEPPKVLSIPSEWLLSRTGFSAETFEGRCILPQPYSQASAGYALIVAAPKSVNKKEFRACGVPVLSGCEQEIRRIWEEYRRLRASVELAPEVLAVLKKIALDADKLGGREIFLGHPCVGGYEFVAGDRIFSGGVHPRVFHDTFRHLQANAALVLDLRGERVSRVNAAITRNFEREIICLSCDAAAPAIEPITITERSRQIMFVEDDERFSLVIIQMLKAKGFEVRRFSDGASALSHALAEPVDLIVSDVNLPSMDGRELLSVLRSKGFRLPVVMLTGDENPLLEAELAMLGASAFISKRRDPRILLAWIHNLIGSSTSHSHSHSHSHSQVDKDKCRT